MSDAGGTSTEGEGEGTFEERLARLADLVSRLEGGHLGLSDSIAAYERGVALVRTLHAELLDVEQRVRTLTAADGDAAVSAADDPADGMSTPVRRRAAPRTAKPSSRAPETSESTSAPPRPPRGKEARRLPGMDDAGAEA